MIPREANRASPVAVKPWRWLDLSYGTGAEQAARTEALLLSVAAGGRPVARVYSWSEPTVFIGVGEPSGDVDRSRCAALGIPVVRRLSGGTAVLHDEHWLSVEAIAAVGSPLVPSDVLGAYRDFAAVIVGAAARLGIAARALTADEARSCPADRDLATACFAGVAPFEIVCRRRKLVGMAQVRKHGAAVLHAAVGLRFAVGPLADVLAHVGASASARLAARVTDLEAEAGREIRVSEVVTALRDAFVEALDDPLERCAPSPGEREVTARLVTDKYSNPYWTYRR